MGMLDLFKTVIMVMAFYSISITLLSYSMPANAINYVQDFTNVGNTINLEDMRGELQGGITSQLGIPVIEMGALIFYSGNIIVDLLLNFATAIPQMIGLLLNGIASLFNIEAGLWAQVELFAMVLTGIIYIIGLIQLVLSIRTGGSKIL